MIAIIGFILTLFGLKIGWFIGFFFAGIYLLNFENDYKDKIKRINIIFSVISILLAFYFLFLEIFQQDTINH